MSNQRTRRAIAKDITDLIRRAGPVERYHISAEMRCCLDDLEIAGVIAYQQRDRIPFTNTDLVQRCRGSPSLIDQNLLRYALRTDQDRLAEGRAHSRHIVALARTG